MEVTAQTQILRTDHWKRQNYTVTDGRTQLRQTSTVSRSSSSVMAAITSDSESLWQ